MTGTSPDPDLSITTSATARGTVVALAGEVDLSNVADVGRELRLRLAEGPVMLDLAELRFMDSSGVRLLDELLREADHGGSRLTLRPQLQPRVRQVLELTGLIEALPFEDE
jgi:anti-anti-sigma factor